MKRNKYWNQPLDLNLGQLQPKDESLKKAKHVAEFENAKSDQDSQSEQSFASNPSSQDSSSSQEYTVPSKCMCEPMLYPKRMRLNKKELKTIKKQALKCRQWKIFQQIVINRSAWWYLRCNRFAKHNKTTEKMLRVARQKIKSQDNLLANG